MNLYESIKLNSSSKTILKESSDWSSLISALPRCKTSDDIHEALSEHLDANDYSRYCDLAYEIDDYNYKVSDAKKDIRRIAKERIGYTEDSIKDTGNLWVYTEYWDLPFEPGEPETDDLIDRFKGKVKYVAQPGDQEVKVIGTKKNLDYYLKQMEEDGLDIFPDELKPYKKGE